MRANKFPGSQPLTIEGLAPCPNPEHMGEFACSDRKKCWEPCGVLGKSAEHVVVANAEESKRITDSAAGSGNG